MTVCTAPIIGPIQIPGLRFPSHSTAGSLRCVKIATMCSVLISADAVDPIAKAYKISAAPKFRMGRVGRAIANDVTYNDLQRVSKWKHAMRSQVR